MTGQRRGRVALALITTFAVGPSPLPAQERPPLRRVALTGAPLPEPPWTPEVRARLEKDLEIARAVMAVAPEREDSYIWLGRRLAYLYRYEEAIQVLTQGLARFPDSYKLLRFRGRKLARSRQMDRALADYRQAAVLVEGVTDSYEPDGMPNARNQFLGSYRANIHYYLGQTSWAVGDYLAVLREMERSAREPLVQNPDHQVATLYWRYLALRKLGRLEEARALVADLPRDYDLLENDGYYDGVLFFQGSRPAPEVLARRDAVGAFAVAMDHHFEGRAAEAQRMWEEITTSGPDGFWPAESELLAVRAARR